METEVGHIGHNYHFSGSSPLLGHCSQCLCLCFDELGSFSIKFHKGMHCLK